MDLWVKVFVIWSSSLESPYPPLRIGPTASKSLREWGGTQKRRKIKNFKLANVENSVTNCFNRFDFDEFIPRSTKARTSIDEQYNYDDQAMLEQRS
eukprot:scaffold274_cov78-Skeletonema_dohrnii-CCMP3373.AAC.6